MSKWRFQVTIQDTRQWYIDFEEEGDGTYDESALFDRAEAEIDALIKSLPADVLDHTTSGLGYPELHSITRERVDD